MMQPQNFQTTVVNQANDVPFEVCHFEQLSDIGRGNILATPALSSEQDQKTTLPTILTLSKGVFYPKYDSKTQTWQVKKFRLNNQLEIINLIYYSEKNDDNLIYLILTTFNSMENCFNLQFGKLNLIKEQENIKITHSIPLDRAPLKILFINDKFSFNPQKKFNWLLLSFSKGQNLILFKDYKTNEWSEFNTEGTVPIDIFWNLLPNKLLSIMNYSDTQGNTGWVAGTEDGIVTSIINLKGKDVTKTFQWALTSPITSLQNLNKLEGLGGIIITNALGQIIYFKDYTMTNPQYLQNAKVSNYDPILATLVIGLESMGIYQLLITTYSKQMLIFDLVLLPNNQLELVLTYNQPLLTQGYQLIKSDVDKDGFPELIIVGFNDLQIIKSLGYSNQLKLQKFKQGLS